MQRYLASPRSARSRDDGKRLYDMMVSYDTIDFARSCARQLAGAALVEALGAFREVPDSEAKQFILAMVLYTVDRDR